MDQDLNNPYNDDANKEEDHKSDKSQGGVDEVDVKEELKAEPITKESNNDKPLGGNIEKIRTSVANAVLKPYVIKYKFEHLLLDK